MTNLEKYLYHLRRIEAHREVATEKEVRKIYKKVLKELQTYLSDIYIKHSEDDALTYSDLAKAGMDARFLEEVELRISAMSSTVANEINTAVSQTYEACYDGMRNAVTKAAGNRELLQQAFATVSAVTPDVIKAAVNNPVSGLTLKDTLEKHRKDVIYDIKQNIGVGLVNGDRYTTMANRISKSLDGDYKKSIRIVRTEAHRVRESGFNDAATDINEALKNGQSGYVMAKTWKTMDDERVRPSRQKRKIYNHVKMDGVTIPQDELFKLPSGATCMCPGQTGVAGEDINCRCYLSYDLVEVSVTDNQHDPWERNRSGQRVVRKGKTNEKKRDIQNATTLEELNEIASEKLGIKVNFTKGSVEYAKEQVGWYEKLANEYNQRTKITQIDTTSMLGKNAAAETFFSSDYKQGAITLSGKNVKPSMQDRLHSYSVKVDDENVNIADLTHEFAHTITSSKGGDEDFWKEIKSIKNRYNRALTKIDKENIVEKTLSYEDAIKRKKQIFISEYANKTVDEFMAEAFSDAMLTTNPSPYSKEVLEVVDKYFKKTPLEKTGGSGTINMILQFFAEKDMYKQESSSLKRAIRNYQKRIEEHEKKIANPEQYIKDWDSMDPRKQEGLKRHWMKENRNFKQSIQDRIEELKRRGDYNE